MSQREKERKRNYWLKVAFSWASLFDVRFWLDAAAAVASSAAWSDVRLWKNHSLGEEKFCGAESKGVN